MDIASSKLGIAMGKRELPKKNMKGRVWEQQNLHYDLQPRVVQSDPLRRVAGKVVNAIDVLQLQSTPSTEPCKIQQGLRVSITGKTSGALAKVGSFQLSGNARNDPKSFISDKLYQPQQLLKPRSNFYPQFPSPLTLGSQFK